MHSANRPLSSWSLLLGTLFAGLLTLALAPQPATAQGSSGPSQQQKAMHYSLYYENFKNENFEGAQKDLSWILSNAPGFPKGDDRNYERAVELYAGLAQQSSNPQKQAAYLDTAMTYLTTAEKKLEKHGLQYSKYEWELERGRFLEQYSSMISEKPEVLKTPEAHYQKAFDMNPTEINPYYINQVIKGLKQANNQEELLGFLDSVAEKRGDDKEIMKIVEQTRQQVFGRNPQARVEYLRSQLEKTPNDAEVMASLFTALVNQGNIQEASQMADRLMDTNPPADIVRKVAQMRLENGRSEEAFATYQKAMDQGAELAAEDLFNMGNAQQRMGNLSKARTYFRKAISKKSDFGKAYIAIGDLYAKAVSQCGGSKMSRNDKAVYWLAVDMYQKAKRVDASAASTADSKIGTYRKYFPNQEDIFYRDDWKAGQSFRIDYGCYSWINETTTVRQAS